MKTRQLGPGTVSAIGLGAMPMSIEGRPGRDQAVATIHAALDAGITLIDTADAYHHLPDDVGHSEELIAQALATYGADTSGVLVATKGGHLRPGDGSWTVDGSPEHLKAACEASLRRLGVEAIGLYQFHRPDPKVPYADSVGAVRDLLDAGKIRLAGVSNADPDQIREAQQVLGGRLVSVQNQFSPSFRSSEPELRLCHDLGLAFLPWSPLGGMSRAGDLGGRHRAFQQVADGHGVSPQQVALAWELAQSPVVIPIPGSSRPATVLDSARAVDLVLSPDELAFLAGPASDGPAWAPAVADLSRADFETAVDEALDRIPAGLTALMDNVVVLVEDEPPPGEPADLFGMYDGVPLTERDSGAPPLLPDRITIFRGPLTRLCSSHEEAVEEVAITVVHEIAHHFGIDDDRLHELGWG